MQTGLIQRQYDEVIAPHYDLDPHSVIGNSLDKAVAQVRQELETEPEESSLRVLDLGIGTGRFIEMLRAKAGRAVQPCGLDVSEKMIDIARARIPDLDARVGDAANLDDFFEPGSFDLVATHFVTGFVPLDVLVGKVRDKLAAGGYWSFAGGTKAGFPVILREVNGRFLRWLFGGRTVDVGDYVCNPADGEELVRALEEFGFAVRKRETFRPALRFERFEDFMDFAYRGGWLTPFIEGLGVHKAGVLVRVLLNAFYFPVEDHHNIEIVLAQKVDEP